ncbi:MAG: cysteine-rich CWC family protein [Chloroflexi bacterium]|nr:cysteine-rich CWC family protein [Chloroflexota bacterium]
MVTTRLTTDALCPVCGEPNHCRLAQCCLYKGLCWCEESIVPSHVLRFLAEGQLAPACLCRHCLTALAYHARTLDEPGAILARVRREIESRRIPQTE